MKSREAEIIEELFEIVTELEARELGANMVIPKFQGTSWSRLCHRGKDLFRQLEG